MGNGSNELIELLVRAFLRPGEAAIIPHPSFVVYPMIVQACGGIRVVVTLKDHRLDLEAMARAITPMTKVVFIANPNNPTATLVTAEEVAAFMGRVPDKVIVVFDEAYFEFAQGPDFPDSVQYMKQGRKVAVLRTFSKAASLAGLRVGYAMADPDCVALLNRIRAPFNVNSLAQAAALAALEDDSHILECLRMNGAGRHFPVRRVHVMGLACPPRQLHPSRRRPERQRRLPAPPEGGRDRAAHVELWHGDGAPRDHRHAGGEPASHQGAEEGLGGGQGRVIRRLAIVGLGLLGGSVAKAARAESLAREIVGIGRNPARLAPALGVGAVDRITTDLREGLAGADMVVLATPVATLERQMAAVWEAAPPQALITDVGSTKAAIVRAAESLSAKLDWGPPHGGLEPLGLRGLWRGPLPRRPSRRPPTAPRGTREARHGIWEAAGGRVVTMDPATHDRAVAAVSHLPHLGADALVDAVVEWIPPGGRRSRSGPLASRPRARKSGGRFEENREALQRPWRPGGLGDLESVLRSGDRDRIEANGAHRQSGGSG